MNLINYRLHLSYIQNIFYKIFIAIVLLLLCNNIYAYDNQRIIDELKSSSKQIPLENALGKNTYDDAIGTEKYRFVGNSKCRLCHRSFFLG